MSLRNFDLNLISFLQITLSEASLTRAARRMRISQPAVSHSLARARELFGDELLVRDGANMRLTPFARQLLPQLDDVCTRTQRILSQTQFSPEMAEIDFTVCANDLTEMLVLPPVIARLAREAPGCRILVRAPEPSLMDPAIDLAIIGAPVPEGPFLTRDLYDDHFVLLARHDHPELERTLSPERFASLSHALVSPTGRGMVGPIDLALERLGLKRRIALSVTRFTILPEIVRESNLVASVPSRFAELPEVRKKCRVHSLPFDSPTFTIRMVWHRLHNNDAAHTWLRGLL